MQKPIKRPPGKLIHEDLQCRTSDQTIDYYSYQVTSVEVIYEKKIYLYLHKIKPNDLTLVKEHLTTKELIDRLQLFHH